MLWPADSGNYSFKKAGAININDVSFESIIFIFQASLIDNETQGACPMSQQGFMLSYILAQEKNVDFKVWTVSQVNPPADFKDKNRAKIYPFVEGISGKDINGQSIAGVMPESADKVEDFFDSVNFDCPHLKRPKNLKDHILGKVDGISTVSMLSNLDNISFSFFIGSLRLVT